LHIKNVDSRTVLRHIVSCIKLSRLGRSIVVPRSLGALINVVVNLAVAALHAALRSLQVLEYAHCQCLTIVKQAGGRRSGAASICVASPTSSTSHQHHAIRPAICIDQHCYSRDLPLGAARLQRTCLFRSWSQDVGCHLPDPLLCILQRTEAWMTAVQGRAQYIYTHTPGPAGIDSH
jgi:hypothetical protein